ncbi:MAG: hypothetical protein LBL39_06485 [Planctomycetaceae bacterium]|nr:hypothetical protein [Planctomycetaceae bacterium]
MSLTKTIFKFTKPNTAITTTRNDHSTAKPYHSTNHRYNNTNFALVPDMP